MSFRILSIGELIWDIFPHTKILGGAPLNFLFQCKALLQEGADAKLLSAVGDDELGQQALDLCQKRLIDTSLIQVLPSYMTGQVGVHVDDHGEPHYEILQDVAYDHVTFPKVMDVTYNVIYFGSLAQRGSTTHETTYALLRAAGPHTLRVYDANFRQNFYSPHIVKQSLFCCDLLKCNTDELKTIASMEGFSGSLGIKAKAILDRYNLKGMLVSKGSNGSEVITPNNHIKHSGFQVDVIDTVGAGDALLATFVCELLQGKSLKAALERANRVASYVCMHEGATPDISII